MSSRSSAEGQGLDRLRTPRDWRHIQAEPSEITAEKIRRAHQLGVVAVVFTADQVAERIRELALFEHTRRNGVVNNTVYAQVMKGGVPFGGRSFERLLPCRL